MNKRFALIPSERERECTHEWLHFRGSIPCTGPRVCSMCGLTEEQIQDEQAARQQEPPPPTGKIGFRRPTVQPIMTEDAEYVPETMRDSGTGD